MVSPVLSILNRYFCVVSSWHAAASYVHVVHRRRLFEMTVGRDFPLLFLSLSALPSLFSSLLSVFSPPVILSSFPYPHIYPLNPAREPEGLGERCKLPRGSERSPAAKRFWGILHAGVNQRTLFTSIITHALFLLYIFVVYNACKNSLILLFQEMTTNFL